VNTLAAGGGTTTKTYVTTTDDWAAKWTDADDTAKNILILGTNAKWSVTGRGQDGNAGVVHSVLTNSFSVSSGEAGGNITLKFDWVKAWGNTDLKSNGEHTYLYAQYQFNGGAWTNIPFADATTKSAINSTINGQAVLTFPGNAGTYNLRFEGDIYSSNSGKGDYAWMTADNVEVSKTVSNIAPAVPTAVSASPINSNTVSLTWNAPADTDLVGYKIYRKLASDSSYPATPVASSGTNSYNDATVQPNVNYTYKIVAVDSGGLESAGAETTVQTPEVTSTPDLVPPVPPGNLRIGNVGSASAELLWDPSPSSDLQEYILLRSTDGINYSAVENITALTTIDKSLQADTNYFYCLIAVDSSGNPSAPGNLLNVRTNPPDTQPPTAPGNFTADVIGQTYVKFKWTASSDNDVIDRYEIEMYDNGWVKKGEFSYPAVTGTIAGLIPGTSYQFRIKAIDASNNVSDTTVLPGNGTVSTNVDTTPPKIIFKSPANEAVEVGTKEPVVVRFDDLIDKSSVNPSTFQLVYQSSGEQTVSGTFSFYPDTNPTQIKFIPDQVLQTNMKYEVRLNGIKNISGVAMSLTSWSYTTGTSEYTEPHGNFSENTAYCSFCHSTHTALKPRLLQNSIEVVCFSCHNGTGSSFNIESQMKKDGVVKTSTHPVFENTPSKEEGVQLTCISCHNPHDGGKDLDTGTTTHLTRLLNAYNKGNPTGTPVVPQTAAHDGNELCWSCHGNVGNLVNSKGYSQYSYGYLDGGKIINPPMSSGPSYLYRGDHQTLFPATKGHSSAKMDLKKGEPEKSSGGNIKCLSCHEKHGSDVKPLLRNTIDGNDPNVNPIVNGKEFCYQCHKNALDVPNSDNTESNSSEFNGQAVNEARGHAQFDCQVCHNPHGSPYPNYLRLNYRSDTTSWKNFNAKDAELCFDCHDQNKLVTKGAAIQGRPQDGNFHGFHLNGTIQATCKNCHRPHGSIPSENGNSKLNHRVGFPSSKITNGIYTRDAPSKDPIAGGSGSCTLNCHGQSHDPSNFNYGGAYRDGTGITGFNANDAYMLKDNWKTTSVLLNTRPDGTGVYDFGDYKIDYRNGMTQSAEKSHFRDLGSTPGDGYLWK
jgi:predicted CXXCH cytochrome family protein